MGLFTEDAVKERLKARVAIDGPTGSGKTWTALQWATVLANGATVGVIDTENRSAAYYAPTPGVEIKRLNAWDPPYVFKHLKQTAPFDPRVLARMIDAAADDLGEDGVLIIDSLTHYWSGEGGTLDIVDDASQRTGNSFVGWKEGSPAQRFMLDKIIHAPFHVIVTMRSKMEYVLETQVKGGKTVQVPRRVGMAPEQRAGVEYEFTVVADMDLEHRLIVSKSRCDVIADAVAPKGRSVDVAQQFSEWLGSGVQRIGSGDAQELMDAMNGLDAKRRKTVKEAFVDEFGNPTELLTDRLDDAKAWVAANTAPPEEPELHGPLADAINEHA
jgi:AAA domain